jgi:hypothetical protein
MALISCQHCGHKCAGLCKCPNCGGWSKPYGKGWLVVVCIAIAVLLIGIILVLRFELRIFSVTALLGL